MTNLRDYYEAELQSLTRDAKEFAKSLPENMAGRLGLSQEEITDPHVLTMLQGFAFLNARTRLKIDDDFSEVTDAFLSILYPEVLAPVPSFAVVQFELNRALGGANRAALKIPEGTELESQAVRGVSCNYRTIYPVELWPFDIRAVTAGLIGQGVQSGHGNESFQSRLAIDLSCFPGEAKFPGLVDLSSVRFFLSNEGGSTARAIYEAIFRYLVDVVVYDPQAQRPEILSLGRSVVAPVGFRREESLQEVGSRALLGYRLLTDLFVLPEKYLFLDLTLPNHVWSKYQKELRIEFRFDRQLPHLENRVETKHIRLGCSPVANQFTRSATIDIDHRATEYAIIPDRRMPESIEVHGVNSVVGIDGDGKSKPYFPLFNVRHGDRTHKNKSYWSTVRRQDLSNESRSALFIQITEGKALPGIGRIQRLRVDCTCTNGGLPSELRRIGDARFVGEGLDQISNIATVVAPTEPLASLASRTGNAWWLINSLVANHTPISADGDSPKALQEVFQLYDCRQSEETRAMISGIQSVRSYPDIARIDHDVLGGYCRGIKVQVELLVPRHFEEHRAFLFAAVMERFLGLYVTVNSFVRMHAKFVGAPGTVQDYFGQPRAGERTLL